MKTNRGRFSEDFHEATGYHFRPWAWAAAAATTIIVVPAAVWGLSVAFSGAHGRGEQIKQVNAAGNRTQWYEHFFDQKKDYDSEVAAAQLAKQQLDQFNHDNPPGTPDPLGQLAQTRSQDQTNLTGAQQQCISTAAAYNNDSLKTLVGAQFKSAGLPDTLDPNACKE